MSVLGPGAVAVLCLRCLAVLAAVNAVVLLAIQAVTSPSSVTASGLYIAVVALLVAAVLVALVGFPAGLLTAHLLRNVTREWVHVVVFALVGAGLSVTLCAMGNLLAVVGWYALVAAAEGAVGAGVARWWTGRVHARNKPWTDAQGAALPWGRMTP